MTTPTDKKLPTVMLVGPWPPTKGGVTTFMVNLTRSPLAQRFRFIPYTTSRPAKKKAATRYDYAAMFSGGISRLIAAVLVTLWHVGAFPFVLRLRRPAVVQIQASDFQAFWECALYLRVARLMGFPVGFRLGGAFDIFYGASGPRAKALIRRTLALPDLLVVQSQYWRDLVVPLGRTRDVLVLPNAIPDALIGDTARANTVPTCLFGAGTEADRKGIADVLGAMELLKARGVAVRFRLLAMLPHSKEQVIARGLADMADMDGYVDHARMLDEMRASDIFLLPSRGEGFPNSLLEAMALGQAAVVTPVGAVPEIVGDDGAITIPLRDPAALADAIASLVQDAPRRIAMAQRGLAIAADRYTQSRVLPALGDAWDALRR